MKIMAVNRPTRDEYFMSMARLASTRGSCVRRRGGCILVNSHHHVIGTGYNGPPSGMPNCFDDPCPGANAKSGEALDQCMAIHAEANALLQCRDTQEIMTAYCTMSPCIHCIKLLANTSCRRVVYDEEYPHLASKTLWVEGMGREWFHMPTMTYEERLELLILAGSRHQPMSNSQPSCPFCEQYEPYHSENCIVNEIRAKRPR